MPTIVATLLSPPLSLSYTQNNNNNYNYNASKFSTANFKWRCRPRFRISCQTTDFQSKSSATNNLEQISLAGKDRLLKVPPPPLSI